MVIVLTLVGCHTTPEQARQLLVGTYHLQRRGDECGKVRSSTLVLRRDGTYDQHIEFDSGKIVDELNQPWTYDGGVHFSNFRITATAELDEYAPETEASLLVDLKHPVVIVLNPHRDCFYTQPK